MEVCYKQKITAIITVVGNTVDEPTFPRRQCCPASVPPVCVRSRCLKLASLANQVSPAQLLVCDILTSVILRPVSPRLSASSSTLFYITHLQYEDGRNERTYAHTHTHTHTTKIHHNSWHGRGFSSIVSASRNTLICGQTLVCFLCLVFFFYSPFFNFSLKCLSKDLSGRDTKGWRWSRKMAVTRGRLRWRMVHSWPRLHKKQHAIRACKSHPTLVPVRHAWDSGKNLSSSKVLRNPDQHLVG